MKIQTSNGEVTLMAEMVCKGMVFRGAAHLCAVSGHRNKSGSCPVCRARRREAQRPDWFAAEERATR